MSSFMLDDQTHARADASAVAILHRCLKACRDGEKGYRSALRSTTSPTLRSLFDRCAKQRAEFVVALHAAAREIGSRLPVRGTPAGTTHRGLTRARYLLSRGDAVLVDECTRGDQAALHIYQSCLDEAARSSLSPSLIALLDQQRAAIEASIAEMKPRC